MVVQATPNIHPGGVHGALFKFAYHSEVDPPSISQLPKANPPKLMTKKSIKKLSFFNWCVKKLEFFQKVISNKLGLR